MDEELEQGVDTTQEAPQEPTQAIQEPVNAQTNATPQGQEKEASAVVSQAVLPDPVPNTNRPVGSKLREQKKSYINDSNIIKMNPDDADDFAEAGALALENITFNPVNKESIKHRITLSGPQSLREQVSNAEYQQRVKGLQQAVQQAALDTQTDVAQLTEQLKAIQEQKPQRTALEQEAVAGSMRKASEDPEWLGIYENNPELSEQMASQLEGDLLLHNYLKEKNVAAASDFDYGVDFIRGITSLDLFSKVAGFGLDFTDGLKEFGDRYQRAKSTDERLSILEEFDKEIEKSFILGSVMDVNPDFAAEVANLAFNASPDERKLALTLGGLEGVLSLVGAGATAKGLAKINTKGVKAVKDEAGAVNPKETMDKAQQSTGGQAELIPLRVPEDTTRSKYSAVQAELEKQGRALDDTLQNLTAPVLRTEQEALPVFNKGTIGRQETLSDGRFVTDFVTTKGNPFAKKSTASRRAKELELPEGSYEIVPETSGYVIRYTSERDAWNAPMQEPKRRNWFTRRFDNIDNWVDSVIHAKGRLAEGAYSQLESTMRKVWKNGFKGLSANQKRDVTRVLDTQRKRNTVPPEDDSYLGRWYTEDEFVQEYRNLTGQEPTTKEITAFQTHRQLSDFAYQLDNRVLYEKAQSRGYSTIKVPEIDQGFTGKVVDNIGDDVTVYNAVKQTTEKAETLGQKYDIVEVEQLDKSQLMEAGYLPVTDIKHIAVKKGTAKVSDLNPQRLSYKAGGRVMYDRNTVFLKQLNVKDIGEGRKMRMRDKTLYRADSPQEAADYAKRWNQGRELARKVMEEGVPAATVRGEFRDLDLGELDDFLQNAKAYGWDLKEPMQVVGNRQTIPVSNNGQFVDDTDDLDYIVEGVGNRFSKRGQGVPHILGDAGDGPLDPIAALSESIDLTARNASFSAFREAALERFKHKFGSYVDVRANAPLTDYLRASPNKRAQDANLVSTIEGHQNYLREVMSLKFEDERWWDGQVTKAANWAYDGLGGDIGKTLARGLNKAKDFSITAQARNLTFNAKLGMFNPASFIMQAAQAPVIAATVPKYGMKSLTMYPLFRTALYGSDEFNPALLREFAEKAKTLGDSTSFLGDFEEAVLEFRRMGMDNFGGNMAYIDANTGSNTLGLARSTASKYTGNVADKGRVFFNEGEMIPRATAYMSSRARWLNDRTINPDNLPATSAAGRQWIHDATNKYMLGMSRADIQQGLRGGLSGFVAQFYSFVFRASAAFVGDTFTKGEKLRMGLAYTAMFGGAGIPLGDALFEVVGDAAASDFIRDAADRGMVDGLLTEALGYETNFSARAGIGQAWEDIYDALTERDTVMEVMGGAAGSTGSRAFDSLTDTIRGFSLMQHPDAEIIGKEAVLALASQVTSFNNTYKAIQAWGTGTLVSNRGTGYLPVTHGELLGAIAGVPTYKYEIMDSIFKGSKAREDAIKDGVQDMLALQEARAKARSYEDKRDIDARISLRSFNMAQAGIEKDVMERVMREMRGSTLFQELLRDKTMYDMQYPEQSFFPKNVANPETLKQFEQERTEFQRENQEEQ